jgi:hypothetical protein
MYRTIDSSIWTDPKFRALPPNGKLLFIYLFSNSHSHLSGIYYIPKVIIRHETGLSDRALHTLLHTLSESGLADFDSEKEVILVRNMFRHQGRGEKHQRSAANQLVSLHKSLLIMDFLALYPVVKKFVPDTLLNTLSDGVSAFGTPEQEKEQEQSTPPNPPLAVGGATSKKKPKRRRRNGDHFPEAEIYTSDAESQVPTEAEIQALIPIALDVEAKVAHLQGSAQVSARLEMLEGLGVTQSEAYQQAKRLVERRTA